MLSRGRYRAATAEDAANLAENSTPNKSSDISEAVGVGGKGRSQNIPYVNSAIPELDTQYIPVRPKKIFPLDQSRRVRSFRATISEVLDQVTQGSGPMGHALGFDRNIPESVARPVLELLAHVTTIDGRRVPDLAEWQSWARAELVRLDSEVRA